MTSRAIGIANGNWRSGAFAAQVAEVRQQQFSAEYIHPRDVKLARLRAAMGEEQYEIWYQSYRYTRPIAERERKIDEALAEWETTPEAELLILQARVHEIELAFEESMSKERRDALFEELAEIGNALQRLGYPLDDWADGRLQTKFGPEVG